MHAWAARIKAKMKELNMTQEQLAHKLGVTRGAVTHYLSGRRIPPLKQFQKLAAILKTDPAWLQFGTSSEISSKKKMNESKEGKAIVHHPIPILSWEQASDLSNVTKIPHKEVKEHIPHFFTDKTKWFALRVRGDAMTASGLQKSFHEGDIIIVDPDSEPMNGSFVIALLPRSKELTFRQYVVDSGIRYLRPLNSQYPLLQMEKGVFICGVIVRCFS